jgi:hypothetical protein
VKAMLLLKFAGLEYQEERSIPSNAPKGKMMKGRLSPTRLSSAFILKKNTVSISTPA